MSRDVWLEWLDQEMNDPKITHKDWKNLDNKRIHILYIYFRKEYLKLFPPISKSRNFCNYATRGQSFHL